MMDIDTLLKMRQMGFLNYLFHISNEPSYQYDFIFNGFISGCLHLCMTCNPSLAKRLVATQ